MHFRPVFYRLGDASFQAWHLLLLKRPFHTSMRHLKSFEAVGDGELVHSSLTTRCERKWANNQCPCQSDQRVAHASLSSRWSCRPARWAAASTFWSLLEMHQTPYIRRSQKQTALHCSSSSIHIHIPSRTICLFACLHILFLLFLFLERLSNTFLGG